MSMSLLPLNPSRYEANCHYFYFQLYDACAGEKFHEATEGNCRAWRLRLGCDGRMERNAELSEHFSYFSRQAVQTKRLLQKRCTFFDGAVAHDCVFGISGEIKDLGGGATLSQLLDQFASPDSWHYHVGDNELDFALMALCRCESCFTAVGFEHPVAFRIEGVANKLPYRFFVFNQQNGLGSAVRRIGQRRRLLLGSTFHVWQIDVECSALSLFTLHHHISSALFDYAIYSGEAEPCAFALL